MPVRLFPRWLRCSDTRCNRLAPVESGLFELLTDPWRPERIRYVHGCRGHGYSRPTAVPARFVLACERGHLDDFPWLYYVHGGEVPAGGEHTLRLAERGTTGEAANLFVDCSCGKSRPMAPGVRPRGLEGTCPAAAGRHPHLGTFEECGIETRTLGLGATNGWFAMQVRAFSLPLAEHGGRSAGGRELAAAQPARSAPRGPGQRRCCPAWPAGRTSSPTGSMPSGRPSGAGPSVDGREETRARRGRPERPGMAGVHPARPDRAARLHHQEGAPAVPGPRLAARRSCWSPGCARCRRSSASPGSTPRNGTSCPPTTTGSCPIARDAPSWVPCAQTRGEGIFLRFSEDRIAAWEQQAGHQARPGPGSRPTRSGAPTGGWRPAGGPASGTCCCTPSPMR